MITEDYVSFETAKLLKEKGFNEPTIGIYYKDGTFEYFSLNKWNSKFITPISAPTLQIAMKWLREVHKLIPIVLTGGDSQNPFYYWFRIDRIIKGKLEDAIYREDEKEFSSYEAAAEAAIKYCLENLI